MDFDINEIFDQLKDLEGDVKGFISKYNRSLIDQDALEAQIKNSMGAGLFTKLEEGMVKGGESVREEVYRKVEAMKSHIAGNIDTLALNEKGKKALKEIVEKSEISKRVEASKELDEKVKDIENANVGDSKSRLEKNKKSLEKYNAKIKLTEDFRRVVGSNDEAEKQALVNQYEGLFAAIAEYKNKVKEIEDKFSGNAVVIGSKEKEARNALMKSIDETNSLRVFIEKDEDYKKLIDGIKNMDRSKDGDKAIDELSKYITSENLETLKNISKVSDTDLNKFKAQVKEFEANIKINEPVANSVFFDEKKRVVQEMNQYELDLSEFGFESTANLKFKDETGSVKALNELDDTEKEKFVNDLMGKLYNNYDPKNPKKFCKKNEEFSTQLQEIEKYVKEKNKDTALIKKGNFLADFFRQLAGHQKLEDQNIQALVKQELTNRVARFKSDYEKNLQEVKDAKLLNDQIDAVKEQDAKISKDIQDKNKEAIELAREEVILKGKSSKAALNMKKVKDKIKDYSDDKDEI